MEQKATVYASMTLVGKNGPRLEGGSPLVNVRRILVELKAERTRLNRAIAALEKLVPKKKSRPSSRGRPTDSLATDSQVKRGKVLVFRRLKISARAKASKAEEA